MTYKTIYEATGDFPFMRVAIPRDDEPGYVMLVETRQLPDGRWTYLVTTTGGGVVNPVAWKTPTEDQLFATRDEAADGAATIIRHGEQFGVGAMTQARYERECAELGIAPEAERTLRHWDAGDYSVSSYGALYLPMLLHSARAATLRRGLESLPTPTARVVQSEEIVCPNCGAPTLRSLLMSASLGTACPNCYDDLAG